MGLREYAAQQQQTGTSQAGLPARQPAHTAGPAEVPAEVLPAGYAQIYREILAFHARHIPPPASDREWAEAAEDASRTCAKLNSNPFAVELLAAVYEEIANVWKRQGEQLHMDYEG